MLVPQLLKAYPSDNPEHAALLQEAKEARERLFPGGEQPEPTAEDVEAEQEPEPEDCENDMNTPDDPSVEEMNELADAAAAI